MTSPSLPGRRPVVVVGLAVTGTAVARHLLALGEQVVALDDRPDAAVRGRAGELGIELFESPGPGELRELVEGASLVVVSPGVPAGHPIFGMDAEIVSELEVAGRFAEQRLLPLVGITGTNGKTTVTTLTTEILVRSGIRALMAGNIGTPLLEVVDSGAEVVVVEASSFQLAMTVQFRPRVATWLNVAEDHLDWHPDMAHYVSSKARIWANQGPGDIAVANRDDPVVLGHAEAAPSGRLDTFGLGLGPPGSHGYHEENGWLCEPSGERIISVSELWRGHPYDRSNALASCATAIAAGASIEACHSVLSSFAGLAHRLQLVAEVAGVRWWDDSKATTPSSVLAALGGFESVVLIAGGRNKGLDLSVLAGAADRLRALVAIGEAAGEVEAAFAGTSVPVLRPGTMAEAVAAAAAVAEPGDSVLLSPACASFDWYRSYAERGRDFSDLVRSRLGTATRREPKGQDGARAHGATRDHAGPQVDRAIRQ